MAESLVHSILPARNSAVDDYVINGNFEKFGSNWYTSSGNSFTGARFEFMSPTFGDLIGRLAARLTIGASYSLSFDVVSNSGSALLVVVPNYGETTSVDEADIIYENTPIAGTIAVPFTATENFTHIRFNANASCIIDNISITVA